MPWWAAILIYFVLRACFYALVAAIVVIMLIVSLIKNACKSEPTVAAANTRKLSKRTDTAVIVHDISQKPRRKLKWQKMLDTPAADARQLAEHTNTPKMDKRVRHQTTR